MMMRVFDLLFSTLVLFFSIPIFILASFLIKLDSPGPVFFRQKRVGRDGKIFTILKFRSMHEWEGPAITASTDKRISRIGRILRRTNFDELPQFINIVKGQMSVVGPRPEVPQIVMIYTEGQRKILGFKPGFTSYATAKFLDEERLLEGDNPEEFYVHNILPKKIEADLDYFNNKSSLWKDMLIILKTVGGTFYA